MTTAAALTKDELTFAQRMLPHFMAGMNPVEAAKAVLADDARLFVAFCDRSHSFHIPTADERGLGGTTRQGTGDVITAALTADVYRQLRAA